MHNIRKIGFCHGATFKIHDPFIAENINLFKKCGCNAIEVNCHTIDEVDKLNSLLPLIDAFEYVSLHMPVRLKYRNDRDTFDLLKKLSSYYQKIGAKLAVVHPDLVEDWDVFDSFPTVNWAIENMDDRKARYKSVDDLKKFFVDHPSWSFVLDVGHCNANDKTMILADDLIKALRGKIKEIHLSGYEVFHDPLHRTKQIEIIERCKNLDVPIIIESTFEKSDGVEGVEKEFSYIMKNLK